MSHFYATIKGSRGPASRCGTKKSGIEGHVRGWNLGARVVMHTDADGRDVLQVYLTGGSSGATADRLIYETWA